MKSAPRATLRSNPLTHDDDLDPKPLNRRQLAKIKTRQKVLDAAEARFMEVGYGPATIRDIAKEAGMSTGAVFANFEDKKALLIGVLDSVLEAYRARVHSADHEEVPAGERVIHALLTDYDFFEGRYRLLEEARYLEGRGDKSAERFLQDRQLLIQKVLQPVKDDLVFRILWRAYDASSRFAMRYAWTRGEMYTALEEIIQQVVPT